MQHRNRGNTRLISDHLGTNRTFLVTVGLVDFSQLLHESIGRLNRP